LIKDRLLAASSRRGLFQCEVGCARPAGTFFEYVAECREFFLRAIGENIAETLTTVYDEKGAEWPIHKQKTGYSE